MENSKVRWRIRWVMIIFFIAVAVLAVVISCKGVGSAGSKKPEHGNTVCIESGLICFGEEGKDLYSKLIAGGASDVLDENNKKNGKDYGSAKTNFNSTGNLNSEFSMGGYNDLVHPGNTSGNVMNSMGAPDSLPDKDHTGAPQFQEPTQKKIWIVDKPAWTESISVPIYSSRPTWFIWFKDGSRKTYYDKDEWINDCKYAPDVSQWGRGKSETYISGYEEKIIEHPEEGHWEYR